jgi:hypothetical protein
MRRMLMLRKIVVVALFLALALFQAMPVFAQSDDGVVPDDGVAAPADAPAAEKEEFTSGESSPFDAGDKLMYLPFAAGATGVEAAGVVTPTWQLVFIDHMCAYPNGWLRNDYNGTGQAWVFAMVDGVCTARSNGIVHKMNVTTTRVFSLAGATAARATFRFKMNTETNWDYLRVEYSCNGGKTYWGMPSQYSGVYGWSVATVSLDACKGFSSVRIRFTFQTDRSILSTLAPVVDYVKVEKFQ